MSKFVATTELRKNLVRQMDESRANRLHALDRMSEICRKHREQIEEGRFYVELNIGNLAVEIARHAETMHWLDRQINELDSIVGFAAGANGTELD